VTYAVLTTAGRKKLKQASRSHVVGIKALFEERYTKQELAPSCSPGFRVS
jgi:hypothetical protein